MYVVASSKTHIQDYECKNDTLFEMKMAKIGTLFLTKTAKKHTIYSCTYSTYINIHVAHTGEPICPGISCSFRVHVCSVSQPIFLFSLFLLQSYIFSTTVIATGLQLTSISVLKHFGYDVGLPPPGLYLFNCVALHDCKKILLNFD